MPRHGVQYVQNEEPSFLKQFKERIGHKDGPDVNTKREVPNFDDDGEEEPLEKEDEKPVVVVLKSDDLTESEAALAQKEMDEKPADLDSKITFKKPVKRSSESVDADNTDISSGKKKKDLNSKGKKSDLKKVKNTSLLSFGDEDEEDEYD